MLADSLRSAGLDVWIDLHGIEAATQWTKEIVEAIETCIAFLVLLSQDSMQSKNVLRELSLASESERMVLPIELEPITLTAEFKYPLAGIQRAQVSDFDGILRSLRRAGLASSAISANPHSGPLRVSDPRKSLMILPFEDISPAQDNGWFADGLTGELISAMSNIKSLRLIDRQTAMSFKNKKIKTALLAKELGVRYFLEGSVRTTPIAAGPVAEAQIKINVELVDIESGDYIWQYAHKGPMRDIFDIQEMVATKVVEGLKLHVTKEESSKLFKRGTADPHAYELLLRGLEYFHRRTSTGYHVAVTLFTQAVETDPKYVDALLLQAAAESELYHYDREEAHLIQVEQLIPRALELDPKSALALGTQTVLFRLRGQFAEAETAGKEYIRRAPDEFISYYQLAVFYIFTGRQAEAIPLLERALELNPTSLQSYYSIVLAYEQTGNEDKRRYWAERALDQYSVFLRLHPDDDNTRVKYANLLMDAGRPEDARQYITTLDNVRDSRLVYEIGLLAIMLGDNSLGMQHFRRAADLGHRDFKEISPGQDDGLYYSPEFQELLQRVAESGSSQR